jgi:hypothetical protein
LTALREERAFPSWVRGPVDRFAFSRFAASRFSEIGFESDIRVGSCVCAQGVAPGVACARSKSDMRFWPILPDFAELFENAGNIFLDPP